MFKTTIRVLAALALMMGAALGQQGGGAPFYQNWGPTGVTTLAVTSSTARVILPTPAAPTALICNQSASNDAYLAFGGVTVVATTSGYWLKAGLCRAYNLKPFGTQYLYVAAITASSTATLRIETGVGSVYTSTNGSGGGGGVNGTSISLAAGSVGAPSLTFSDSTTGMYRPASNVLGFAVSGGVAGRLGDSNNTSFGVSSLAAIPSGIKNTAFGDNAGATLSSGAENTVIGYRALVSASAGSNNVAVGSGAATLATGNNNIAIGRLAMQSSVAVSDHIAIGAQSLNAFQAPVSAAQPNIAIGTQAMATTTNAYGNIAIGPYSLQNMTNAEAPYVSDLKATGNIAIGTHALYNLTSGYENVAIGAPNVMNANTTGFMNVAIGTETFKSNTTGQSNTVIGGSGLQKNTTGGGNVAVGQAAGGDTTNANGNTTGSNNTFLGSATAPGSTTQRSYMTLLGSAVTCDRDATVCIGRPGTDIILAPYFQAFGGATSSFPALKRNTTTLEVRLGDDSAYANLAAAALVLSTDVFLNRDAANILALRNSTTAQTYRVYNTFTNSSNGEWLEFTYATNRARMQTTSNGSGVARAIDIISAADVAFWAGSTRFWNISTPGHFLAQTDNANDIGASGATRPRNGYFGTSLRAAVFVGTGSVPSLALSGGTCAGTVIAGAASVGTVTLTGACAATNTMTLSVMPTAPTGYACDMQDRTTGTNVGAQTSTSATTAVFTFSATTGATDVIQYKCIAY